MYQDFLDSPIGWLKISANDKAVTALDFDAKPVKAKPGAGSGNAVTAECKKQLVEYFAGQRKHFDLPLDGKGTPFQQSVWRALMKIPYGATCAYVDIAETISKPKAVRAVGAANGRNPIPIIVPCHRVIGRNGSLTGFGGGLDKKHWLLQHEGALLV